MKSKAGKIYILLNISTIYNRLIRTDVAPSKKVVCPEDPYPITSIKGLK